MKLFPHCQSPRLYQYILVNRLSSNGFWCPFLASFKFYRPQQNGNKANLRDVIAGTALVISNWIQIVNFSARVTVKFDGWPQKTIGHFFYNTSSFVHHFVAIGDLKPELQSGNAQFGSNSTIFRAVWPCNLTYDLEQGKSEGFESCDRPVVRKRPIWVKIGDVLSRVNLKFDGWPWKTIGHLSFAVSSFVQHFIAIGEFKLELLSGNAQFGSNSMIFRAMWPWNLTYDLEKQ